MKSTLLFYLLFATISFSFAQKSVIELVEEGITYHDSGDFEMAIETYKKALALDPNSTLVSYEISLSFYSNQDYENSIKYSDRVLKNKDDTYDLKAYHTKGSSLDALGRTKESNKVFKKAIKKYPSNYLLHYNLALNYYKLKDYEEAEEYSTNAIINNPLHSSSHLLLAYIHLEQEHKIKSYLSLHYFLLLEPTSNRAIQAFKYLEYVTYGNVTTEKEKPNTINISLSSLDLDSEFPGAQMMLSFMIAGNNTEKNEGKSKEKLLIENTETFFGFLGAMKDDSDKKQEGLYWDFYIPFFYLLSNSEHMDAYCYHITEATNDLAKEWIQQNTDKMFEFEKWLDEHQY